MDFDTTLHNNNNLLSFTLNELKDFISVQENISLNSQIYLSQKSYSNIKNKKLKLTLKRLTPENGIFLLKIVLLADSGNFTLRYWDDTNEIIIDEGVKGIYQIDFAKKSSVYIGEGTTSNGIQMICININIKIGKDCMFSDGILFQATDQHGIVDIKKKEIINNHTRHIELQEHVWLGRNATIMPDVTIGEGSVVATGALVTKKYTKFCYSSWNTSESC